MPPRLADFASLIGVRCQGWLLALTDKLCVRSSPTDHSASSLMVDEQYGTREVS